MMGLKIMHHNIRGLNHKLNELKIHLKIHEPDIITINECLKIKNTTKIPNYTICQPNNNTGQGVAIIHKNNLNIEILDQIITTKEHTNLHFSILLTTPKDKIQIATVYCPRRQPSTELIEKLLTRHDKTILSGDFNSKHENFGHDKSDKSGRGLVYITEKHKMTKLNDNGPTYVNDTTGKEDVKDLIFSSPALTQNFKEFWVDEDLGSDHKSILATFDHNGLTVPTEPKIINLYHQANWTHINNLITNDLSQHSLNHESTTQDIDTYINNLTQTINKHIEENVKKITIDPKKIGLSPITRDEITKKNQLRKIYQRTRDQHTKSEYNKQNKKVKKMIKNEQEKKWNDICDEIEIEEDPAKKWRIFNNLTNNSKKKTKYPTFITTDNKGNKIKSSTPEEKIKLLQENLENIFTNDATKKYFDEEHKNKIETEIYNISPTLQPLNKIHPDFNKEGALHNITKQEIKILIKTLNTKKASGPDRISNTIIKNLLPSLLNPLHTLYNLLWFKGYHTTAWKKPLILLFNKPNKPASNPANYRPISLLSNLSKILEKIVTQRLTNWANTQNLLNPQQAGFRHNKETHDKIFELAQTTLHARNLKHFSAAIFMDVEKAFDKVWHAGLVHSLIKLDIPQIFLRYISSFISDRHVYFSILGITSDLIKLNFGVPQGSPLSPLLFILYVSDIPIPKTINTYLSQFADDIKIYSTSPSIHKIQNNLQKALKDIIKYCGKKRISINDSKTFEIIFTPKSRLRNLKKITPKPILCDQTPIPIHDEGKFLGITFDKNLTFKQHIKNTQNRAKYRSTAINRLAGTKTGPSPKTQIRFFNATIRPLFEYGHTATITTNKKETKKWEIIQTKFIRKTLRLPFLQNTTIRKLANQPAITDRILLRTLNWYNKTEEKNPDITKFISKNKHKWKTRSFNTPLNIILNHL